MTRAHPSGILTLIIGASHILHDFRHCLPQSLIHRLICHFHCGKLPAFTGPLLVGDISLEAEKIQKIQEQPVRTLKVLVAQSCLTLCDPVDCSLCPGNSPDKKTGVGSHSFLQGIFPTQRSILGLPHCRQILYHLSHQGSPYKQ